MRLRVQTFPPLPDVKAWFIPEEQGTVYDLKALLCQRIQALKDGGFKAQHLLLLLDGFELLDDSPADVLRDGDLVHVKSGRSLPSSIDSAISQSSKKRKRFISPNQKPEIPSFGYRATLPKDSKTADLTKPASLRSSEDESSSSDSDSDSSSSSSSSAASSSSLSSTSSEESLPAKKVQKKSALQTASSSSNVPAIKPSFCDIHVPPGYGKPSTHSRNKRRKKKREFAKLGIAVIPPPPPPPPAPPKGVSETNSLPLGTSRVPLLSATSASTIPLSLSPPPERSPDPSSSARNPSNSPASAGAEIFVSTQREPLFVSSSAEESERDSKYVLITHDQVAMGSLRNKNKKKGFKKSMAGPIPKKIVFSGEVTGSENPNDSTNSTSTKAPAKVYPRLIPPSELQEQGKLPPNMFVTSVDVEAGMWDNVGSSKKKKKKSKGNVLKEDYSYSQNATNYSFEGVEKWEGYQAEQELPYVEEDPTSSSSGIDWHETEKSWETSSIIQQLDQIKIDAIIGWKALAINPQTFTPEILLSLARILECSAEGDHTSIKIKNIHRDGSAHAALSFGGAEDAEEGVMEEEATVGWKDVIDSGWRLVDLAYTK